MQAHAILIKVQNKVTSKSDIDHSEMTLRKRRKALKEVKLESLDVTFISRSSICIKSPFLRAALVAVVGYYPSFHGLISRSLDRETEEVILNEPYAVIFHHFAEIKNEVKRIEIGTATDKHFPETVEEPSDSLKLRRAHLLLLY